MENGAGLFPSVWRLGSPDSFSREWFAISFLLGWLALKLLNLTKGVRSAEYGSDPSGDNPRASEQHKLDSDAESSDCTTPTPEGGNDGGMCKRLPQSSTINAISHTRGRC